MWLKPVITEDKGTFILHAQLAHDAIITSLLRQNDVTTSFWRNDYVTITPCPLGDYKTMTAGDLATKTVIMTRVLKCVPLWWLNIYRVRPL